ncbi:MAG: WYL domain-containing protein, partial [Succiniclasticum sp.]|nr:WYL domain-containing protein [Succiniclasticum sp.]
GEEVKVTLEAENGMVGILLDRFGKDIPVKPVDAGHFRTSVVVAVSSQFLGWIMALGDGVKIIGPDKVVARMKEEIRLISQMYEN